MASFLSSLSSVAFVALPLVLILVSPASSTSRRALDAVQNGFKITLQHVDSSGNFTKFERLQRATKRGRKRMQRFNEMANLAVGATNSEAVESSIYPGDGEYLMKLSIGTPPATFSAIMDTGSDLVWTQCKPCQECFQQSTPIFDPSKSSSFSKISCSGDLCQALQTPNCGGDGCEYMYTYGDYSSTQGVLATETFTFDDKVSIHKIGFGCGSDNEGSGFSQGAGLVGLGRGPLSLVSQLKEPKFSYCLTSVDGPKTSTLLMGSRASANTSSAMIKTTPLIKNPSHPSFYYLSLEGITVGDTRLSIQKSTFALNDDGTGGLIIDSGTTITYLEESAFDLLKKEFVSHITLQVDTSDSTGLDLCFHLPSNTTDVEVPKLVFHFDRADLELPSENYIIADASVGLMCLAMGSSNGMSIFGNVQQQNMLVVHDLSENTLSFVPTQCDRL